MYAGIIDLPIKLYTYTDFSFLNIENLRNKSEFIDSYRRLRVDFKITAAQTEHTVAKIVVAGFGNVFKGEIPAVIFISKPYMTV